MADENTTARIGDIHVALIKDTTTDKHKVKVHLASTSNYNTLSTAKIYISGNHVNMYEDNSGNRALAVYDIKQDMTKFASPTVSGDHYINDGIKYSFVESVNNKIFHCATFTGNDTKSVQTVWFGVGISLNSDKEMICREVTGDVDEIKKSYIGGVPLVIIRSGSIWSLGISNK